MDQVTVSRELLQQALDDLTNLQPKLANGLLTKRQLQFIDPYIDEAMSALRTALEQPVVKPVAWIRPSGKAMLAAEGYCKAYLAPPCDHPVPLYTAPQAQQLAEVPCFEKAKLDGPSS